MITYDCYHGTSQYCGYDILKSNEFMLSDRDNEWAGSGVYFFISPDNKKAIENATKWAIYHKRFKHPCVLSANVNASTEDDTLDLTSAQILDFFEECRFSYFEIAAERAKQRGTILEDEYVDGTKLDCTTINNICEEFGYTLVIRYATIKAIAFQPDYHQYPPSRLSNCVILCARTNDSISNIKKII